jgi:hypothetical protein
MALLGQLSQAIGEAMRIKTLMILAAALVAIAGCGDGTVDDLDGDVDVPETDTEELETDVPETDTEEPDTDAGASTSNGDYSEACGDAVRQLSEVDDLQTAGDDLDNVITTCESPAAFQAAAADHLDVDVPDPLIAERCADPTADDAVGRSAICAELD